MGYYELVWGSMYMKVESRNNPMPIFGFAFFRIEIATFLTNIFLVLRKQAFSCFQRKLLDYDDCLICDVCDNSGEFHIKSFIFHQMVKESS